MTIRKTSDRASKVLDHAHNVRCYSLSNNFRGEPLADRPVIAGVPSPGEVHQLLVEVSPVGFLRHELTSNTTKLIDSGSGHFTIRVHSNLWYIFQSAA
jgi:hypothetical protein